MGPLHAPRAGGHRRTESSAGRARSSWRRVWIPRRRGTRTSGERPSRSPPARPIWAPPDRASSPHPLTPPRLQGRRDAGVPRGRDPPHLTRPRRLPPRSSSSPGRSTAPGCSAAGIPTSTPTSAMPSPPCAGPSPRATSSAWSSRSRTTTPRRPTGRSRGSPSISSSATTTTQLASTTQLAGRTEEASGRKRRLSRSRAVSRRRGSVLASLRRVPEQDRLLRRPADAPAAGGDQRRAPLVRDCRVFHARAVGVAAQLCRARARARRAAAASGPRSASGLGRVTRRVTRRATAGGSRGRRAVRRRRGAQGWSSALGRRRRWCR